MRELLSELQDILNEEKTIYDGLLKISKDKTKVIVEGKVSELEKITKLEQSIMLRMSKLEEKRENNIERIAAVIGEKPANLTISNLIGYADDEAGKKLQGLKDSIMKNLKELKDLNDLNSKLINNSLEYINFSLNLLSSAGAEDNNYTISAEKTSKKGRNFFDLKI